MAFFSPTTCGFYAAELKENFVGSGTWPADAIEISTAEYTEFKSPPPSGKMLGAVDGKPAWIDIPAPTQEEIIASADEEKKRLIVNANEFMNSKQWPGKAAIGRLKGDELAQYNVWLDHLDALEAVDTTRAPDIEWPTPPVA